MLATVESALTLSPGTIAAIVFGVAGVLLTVVGSLVKVAFDVGKIRGMLQTRLETVEQKAATTEREVKKHAGRLSAIEAILPLHGCT